MRKIYDSKIIYTFFNAVFSLYVDNGEKKSWQKVNIAMKIVGHS